MAEKPRLKKSDEILGIISTEPARSKRGRGPDKNGDAVSREQETEKKSDTEDFIEEEIELTEGPILPSAQSLAEKLLPKKSSRTRELSAYRPSRTTSAQDTSEQEPTSGRTQPEPTPAASLRQAVPTPAPAAQSHQAVIEFDDAHFKGDVSEPAAVELKAAPNAAGTAAIEFGIGNASEINSNPAPNKAQSSRTPAPEPTTVAEYTFQSFEKPKAAEDMSTVWEFSAETENAEPRRERTGRQEQPQAQPRKERIIQPLRKRNPMLPDQPPPPIPQREAAVSAEPEIPTLQASEPQPIQQPIQQAPPQPPPEPQISEAERNRQEFLNRIANQFELQFEEKFENGKVRPQAKPTGGEAASRREPLFSPEPRPQPREPLFSPEPRPQPKSPPPAANGGHIGGEDFLSYVQRQERERQQRMGKTAATPIREPFYPKPSAVEGRDEPALGFIEKFKKDIQEEEQQRAEDFKETLSQKFMRERERYLKELGVNGEPDSGDIPEEDPEPVLPQGALTRRKLDFQIRPEMHMQDGEAPPNPRPAKTGAAGKSTAKPANPVTYTRGGATRPQTDLDDEISSVGGFSVMPPADGKKTGEQLLREHSMRARIPAMPKPQPANLKFTFETPEERAQKAKAKGEKESILPTEKWPRRMVLIAMIAGLLAIGLVVWSMVAYYNLSSGQIGAPEQQVSEPAPTVEETLDIYNDRVFTQTATLNNVIFKNAGTLLKNAHVKDYVVIEGVEGTGRIRLEDLTVDSAVSVKSSGADTLELHNVKAARVIINNPKTAMTINATGNTDIEVLELRTKSTVKQSELGADSGGIRDVIATSPEAGGEVDARLDGLDLRTLQTEAGTAILAFSNNTRVETASADGSLTLSGDGRISTLSIGSKVGQGAGDLEERKDIILFVKGVSITNLNVKSPATLNLSTTIDSIATADAITLGGQASVGSLTLNPKADSSSRLLVDIVSANVQAVYSNTQARVNITGSSRVNELTADASTYVLGNKVNHLRVNADDVIYENEPDKITPASGIKPPQSKADNPNIDYNLGTPSQNATDATGEDFATTCGHSRESGGFLLGDGSKDAPYEVASAMQLAHCGSHLISHFIQTADIDISSESAFSSNFPVIGGAGSPFEGVFDGGGFAISRLKIVSQAEHVGLFGANRGLLQNVHLYSGDIAAAASSPSYVGGIVGLNYDGGQLRSCANGANITGNQNAITGGIAGGNSGGRIHDCYNYAKISGVNVVGGIAGLNRQGASITGSYNSGAVDGIDQIGSLAGKNEDGVIANCYYLANTAGYGIGSGSGTATEKTSEELASPQMAADLSAGNDASLWIAGSTTAAYRYPIHRNPAGGSS